MLDYSKFPVGTKVQAVFSEDGEWFVRLLQLILHSDDVICFIPAFALPFSCV